MPQQYFMVAPADFDSLRGDSALPGCSVPDGRHPGKVLCWPTRSPNSLSEGQRWPSPRRTACIARTRGGNRRYLWPSSGSSSSELPERSGCAPDAELGAAPTTTLTRILLAVVPLAPPAPSAREVLPLQTARSHACSVTTNVVPSYSSSFSASRKDVKRGSVFSST